MPPPLPKPQNLEAGSSKRESQTATLRYPTHAAIETSQSSLSKGDWGLKRSLPNKTFPTTSPPLIRIGDVDSMDHIAEFESAADYTQNIRKWQEMNLPISVPLPEQRSAASFSQALTNMSVFESKRDTTVKGDGGMGYGRWKFKGPWLAGKTEMEFRNYIKSIRKRKLHLKFRRFIHWQLLEKMIEAQKREATDLGEDHKFSFIKISEEEIDASLKQLRHDKKRLHETIEKFLDLPNFTRLSGELGVDSKANQNGAEDFFRKRGPPKTHPSAGLSYLRTYSYIHNHPILGPQAYRPPVCGRILAPQTKHGNYARPRAKIGIAGVVAHDSRSTTYSQPVPPGLVMYDPDIPGGGKDWFHPEHATIDPTGRIILNLQHSSQTTVALYKGILPPEQVDRSIVEGGDRIFPSTPSSPSTAQRQGSNQSYGLEGMGNHSSSGRAKPFNNVEQETDAVVKMLRTLTAEKR